MSLNPSHPTSKKIIPRRAGGGNTIEPPSSTAALINMLVAEVAVKRYALIGPQIAQRIINECKYPLQRPVDALRVQAIENRVQTKNYNYQLSNMTICRTPDGKFYLVNGQHHAHAILSLNHKLQIKFELIECENMAAVQRVYSTFDQPESVRTDSEMLTGAGVVESLDVAKQVAIAAYRAMVFIRNGYESPHGRLRSLARNRDGRLEDINDWRDEIQLFDQIFRGCEGWIKRAMMNSGPFALAITTLRHDRKIAVEFLTGISENDRLAKSDPRARLISEFGNTKERKKVHGGSVARMVSIKWALAYNAFRDQKTIAVLRNAAGPLRIKGTPITLRPAPKRKKEELEE